MISPSRPGHRADDGEAVGREGPHARHGPRELGVAQQRKRPNGVGQQLAYRVSRDARVELALVAGGRDQDAAVRLRHYVATVVAHRHGRHEARLAEKQPLSLRGPHRQRLREPATRQSAPRPRREHHVIGEQAAFARFHSNDAVAIGDEATHLHALGQPRAEPA